MRNRAVVYSKAFNKQEISTSQRRKISEISNTLASYDLIDILTKIGIQCLSPENASHSTRLEALMYAAALNRNQGDKPKITKIFPCIVTC